jgi:integrase
MKIERHGQAKILTQQEIELLFNKGLLSERDRTLFGVCLYTACRIAEACSLMVKDIYTNSGAVRSTINGRKANTKGKLQTRTIPVIEDLRSSLDILAFPRRPDLLIPRPPPEPPLEAPAPQLSGSDFERSVRADRHRGSLHPQL